MRLMNNWQSNPPTYDQWTGSSGYWWRRTVIPAQEIDGLYFKEIYIDEIVEIALVKQVGQSLLKGGRLIARNRGFSEHYLDETPEGLYLWQAVQKPK